MLFLHNGNSSVITMLPTINHGWVFSDKRDMFKDIGSIRYQFGKIDSSILIGMNCFR